MGSSDLLLKESSDNYNVNIMMTRWKEKTNITEHVLPIWYLFVNVYQIFIKFINTYDICQYLRYVNNQSMCCIKLLFN